ncbi:MAG: hypothetical protein V4556_07135 [Bacteroidota bacterium]
MTITKTIKIIIVSLFIVLAIPFSSTAINNTHNIGAPLGDSASDVKIAAQITQRVLEIQSMDKTSLSSTEKKALKNELRDMKAQADGLNRGVYLSVGAIIIILLLLILIL